MPNPPTKSRTIPFKTIRARAEKRKGGAKGLEMLLPLKPDMKAVAELSDDRMLSEMTKRVFSAGFAWSVIETKWPGFEKAFLAFNPARLSFQPDDFWDGLLSDTRIVRNGAKIQSVRENAAFVQEIAREHGSFGKFLAKWPSSDQIGLLEVKPAQLGPSADWMRTTDMARIDADGFLWITGRADQAIIRGGFKIIPADVRRRRRWRSKRNG